jgi:hypothetical protein
MSRRLSLLCIGLVVILSLQGIGTIHAQLNPNVGVLRVDSVKYPRQVAPSTDLTALVDAEYSIRTNATIKADLFQGSRSDLGARLWESPAILVSGGGDQIWAVNLTAPPQEQTWSLIVITSYLDSGKWTYLNNSSEGPGYFEMTIKIATNAQLTIDLGIPNVPVTIDSSSHLTSQTGEAIEQLPVGRNYEISIPPMVELQNSTRLIFVEWQDGVTGSQRTFLLDGDSNIVATFRTEYLLQVGSAAPGIANSTWKDAGSTVTLSANATVPLGGPLSPLGLIYTFKGWAGDVQSAANQVSVTMNGPKTVTANYALDYTPLAIPTIIIVAVLSSVLFLLVRRRSAKKPTQSDREPGAAEQVEETVQTQPGRQCGNCGKEVESGWTHCIFCGKSLMSSEPVQGR